MGTHGGREREELSLRVQDAGNGGAEVRLTFLPHGPPAAALIFRMRDVLPCPYLEYWLARQRACSQCPLFGVEKRQRMRRGVDHNSGHASARQRAQNVSGHASS